MWDASDVKLVIYLFMCVLLELNIRVFIRHDKKIKAAIILDVLGLILQIQEFVSYLEFISV